MSKNIYTQKSSYLISFISILILSLVSTVLYLNDTKKVSFDILNQRKNFVFLTGLPDLAISTESTYIRHRTMSDIFSIYKDDGSLREYFPSTYVYSHSHILNGDRSEK